MIEDLFPEFLDEKSKSFLARKFNIYQKMCQMASHLKMSKFFLVIVKIFW
jgi:hypothetical protein